MALSLWEQKMKLVKISNEFFNECRKNNVHRELLFNEDGRPSVLIVKLKYKDQYHKFVVPLRSNISPKTPKINIFHCHRIQKQNLIIHMGYIISNYSQLKINMYNHIGLVSLLIY